jgi:hypothetical protein
VCKGSRFSLGALKLDQDLAEPGHTGSAAHCQTPKPYSKKATGTALPVPDRQFCR